MAKKLSTASSHGHEVGVNWNVKHGWRASHALIFGCLLARVAVEDDVDHLARICALDGVRKRRNS